jgi:hypothetical protein
MATKKMTHCLDECKRAIQGYPSPPNAVKKMEALDKQMVEMQLASKNNANQYIPQTSPSANQYVLFISGTGHTRGYWHVSSIRHCTQAI